ncbi:MAG: hypothetical protein Q8N36_05780 [bacterium]|nr:hypothetical protein [bacterium]
MMALLGRMFKKTWVVQLSVALLLASSVGLLTIYNVFLNNEGQAVNLRLESRIPAGLYLVSVPTPTTKPSSLDASIAYYAGWKNDIYASNLGDLPIAVVDLDASMRNRFPNANVAAIPRTLATKYNLRVGDTFTLLTPAHTEVKVVEIFKGTVFNMGIDMGERIVVFLGPGRTVDHLVFGSSRPRNWVRDNLGRTFPSGLIEDSVSDNAVSGQIIGATYSLLSQARISLVMFIAMAFLTIKLMAFMEGRRLLAILNAIGLKKLQLAAFIGFEATVSPFLGMLLGGLGVLYIFSSTTLFAVGNKASLSIAINAMLVLLPAMLIGVLIPSRLAQMASVNELLLERPIALFRDKVSDLPARVPAFDYQIAQGVKFIKLPIINGNFEGYIFRKFTDEVKVGEVLAVGYSWWGLRVTDYLSPATGIITYFQPDTGYFGITPF